MFSPFDLPLGILLLVTDQLSSPADFVLHRSLIDHLKGAKSDKKAKAIVLSVSEQLPRWKAIAAKSNVHLDQQTASGAFVFVDVLERVPPPPNPDNGALLRPILDEVVASLGTSETTDTLVILDDLAALDWLGFSLLDITRFCRALAAACRKANATLLIRQHILTPSSSTSTPILDDLFRALHQLCTYHMEVLPLASGRSGAVSGQVALHPGPGTSRIAGAVRLLPRSAALQYKLTDGGAVFFERGTGAGVL
ncbi:hypothetical protein C8R43DRAFT_1044052 [Mycena crocata]|nr:hypothetical protein C8R43DRAFT_1044052 [Mycena crocata]